MTTSTTTATTEQSPEPITNTNNTHEYLNDAEDRFACNICFESVQSPVVTRCGHLYCWSCLYIWLEPGMTVAERRYLDSSYNAVSGAFGQTSIVVDATRRICPVCKSECNVKDIVPIYVRESTCTHEKEQQLDNVNQSSKSFSEGEVASINNNNEEGGVTDVKIDASTDINQNTNINNDNEQENYHHSNSSDSTTGLRRRRTAATTTTTTQQQHIEVSQSSQSSVLPSRPFPPPSSIPQHHHDNTSHNSNTHNVGPTGMSNSPALALHQSLFQALVNVQANNNNNNQSTSTNSNTNHHRYIPSLHDRRMNNGVRNESSNNANSDQDDDFVQDATQEFLSRLLMMLGCFVILCLLLF